MHEVANIVKDGDIPVLYVCGWTALVRHLIPTRDASPSSLGIARPEKTGLEAPLADLELTEREAPVRQGRTRGAGAAAAELSAGIDALYDELFGD